MKFSFSLLRQLAPEAKNKKEIIGKLNIYSFEAEGSKGDVIEVSVPPNRFSSAASHWGLAGEIRAILGKKFKLPIPKTQPVKKSQKFFKVEVKDKNLCSRYRAQYFDGIAVKSSPRWMQKVLADCGLRPVNNVVDIMNYAMLETGQPLHAFDFDKIADSHGLNTDLRRKSPSRSVSGQCKSVIVRKAKKGEKIRAIDDKIYGLSEDVLVIADAKKPIAIAGIKGGKDAEIDRKTKRIIVEAANFESAGIYKSSRELKLETDASIRFSHGINPNLAELGLGRAAELLKAILASRAGYSVDENFSKPRNRLIKFDLERFQKFIGLALDFKTTRKHLENLGFEVRVPAASVGRYPSLRQFLVEAPILRDDIETFEDVAEEVARLCGYNNLRPEPPKIHLIPSGYEDQIVLKSNARRILAKMGLNEVYNYSFISDKDAKRFIFNEESVELLNPVSQEFSRLRPSFVPGFIENVENNFRFFDDIRIFEIGKKFLKTKENKFIEKLVLGIAFSSKNKETLFELKGLISEFLKRIGLVDFFTAEAGAGDWVEDFAKDYISKNLLLKIESGGEIIGYVGQIQPKFGKWKINVCEIDLELLLALVSGEREYRALSRYPSIMRDISLEAPPRVRIGNLIQVIQEANRKYIQDVDLIDEYRNSFTFRIVFQAEDRTLTDKEVNREMEKIGEILKTRLKAKIR